MAKKEYIELWQNHQDIAAIKCLMAEKGYAPEQIDNVLIKMSLDLKGGIFGGESIYYVTSVVVRFLQQVLLYQLPKVELEQTHNGAECQNVLKKVGKRRGRELMKAVKIYAAEEDISESKAGSFYWPIINGLMNKDYDQ